MHSASASPPASTDQAADQESRLGSAVVDRESRLGSAVVDHVTIPANPLHKVVERLRASFDTGLTRPLRWRREQLQRLLALALENQAELTEALHADLGKSALEGFMTEVAFLRPEIELALKNLARWTRPRKVATPLVQRPSQAQVVREPLGVVLIIAPWNYPVQLLLAPLIGALAAGNCAVLKPSELAPRSAAVLAQLVPRYLDPEAVTLVEGGVPETTALLQERFDHIFFTGGGAVGRVVMAAAARHLTPVTLELGGKSPVIVDRDVDLTVAARRIVWGKFLNAGQTCIAPDYVLVHESREAELLSKMTAVLREFYGDDPRRSPDYSRVINERHLKRLAGLLRDSGGQVVCGGEVDEATRYMAPTIMRGVSADSKVMSEEIFGPILPVLTVPSTEAAIRFITARDKPLALYVFSSDEGVVDEVIARTSSGAVGVNNTILHVINPDLPFGGVGGSGMGAYHGEAGFEVFTHRKAVVNRTTAIDPSLMYPPYTPWKQALLKRVL